MIYPIILSLITIFQGSIGGRGLIQVPKTIEKFVVTPVGRFICLCTIAYTASQNLVTAILSTVFFVIIMYLLRSDDEKQILRPYMF